MKGCLMVGLVPVSALLLVIGYAATLEAEQPDQFPGLRDNRGPLVLIAVVLSAAAALVALIAAARSSRLVLATVGTVCVLLLAGGVLRAYSVAPMLACLGHNAVAREADGSYSCADR
ncbi:hypothetical protein [Kitasatospora camelliae]|uniref:Uncharacterized protein n=1 Tax=Kitasatospora camelliae TaxID=3156397 RepID=A0AAU8JZL5_9ACTN